MAIARAPTWEQAASQWRAPAGFSSVRSALAVALTGGLVVSGLVIVLDAGSGPTPLVPASPAGQYLFQGVGWHLGYGTFAALMVAMSICYGALLAFPRVRLGTRATVVAIVLLQLIVFAGPILISQDVFSYIAYARMGVLHGIDPYVQGPAAIANDPIYEFVGRSWIHSATAYGPIFTLISYPLGLLGLAASVWAYKLLALVSSLGALALVWRCARLRDLDPAQAILFVGANPALVIYGIGGAHNDLLMNLFVMAGVTLSLSRRRASGAATLVAGALVKATAAMVVPFLLVARRERGTLLATVGALVLGLGIGYLAFGLGAVNEVAVAARDAGLNSQASFSTEVARLFGHSGPIDHLLLDGALLVGVMYLLWRTHRGYDWISASTWGLLLLAVVTTWLLPWYMIWAIPLAAIARDRRLVGAVLVVQLLMAGTGIGSVGGRELAANTHEVAGLRTSCPECLHMSRER